MEGCVMFSFGYEVRDRGNIYQASSMIISVLHGEEVANLVAGFGMRLGWQSVYDEVVRDAAVADGAESPGRGRFTGMLDANMPEKEVWYGYEPNRVIFDM